MAGRGDLDAVYPRGRLRCSEQFIGVARPVPHFRQLFTLVSPFCVARSSFVSDTHAVRCLIVQILVLFLSCPSIDFTFVLCRKALFIVPSVPLRETRNYNQVCHEIRVASAFTWGSLQLCPDSPLWAVLFVRDLDQNPETIIRAVFTYYCLSPGWRSAI